ncbi:MAG: D-alanyl-D-alanine carboxypeptidase [Clostridia bacterium]|nr:D-alanyl-D-alanine carboxypeptidase [Clostridia bacterium]
MKNIIKTAVFAALFILITVFSGSSVFASDDPDIKYTDNCCVMNADYGDVLYEKNSEEAVYPAGSCKMMTALIALEHYGDDLSGTITVSSEALGSQIGSGIGILPGDTVTVKDMLAAMIIGNYNDAAMILAFDISGSADSFVLEMNNKAKELGMNNTNYRNPSGIDESGAVTTSYDICLLAKELCSNKVYTSFTEASSYLLESVGNFTVYNKNYFISSYYNLNYVRDSVFGLNASATENAGSCVCVADKTQNGFTNIVCVMGARTPEELPYKGCNTTYDDCATLLKWASDSFELFTVVDTADMICEVPVQLSEGLDHVILLPKTNITVMLPRDVKLDEEISFEWELEKKELRAPVKEGEHVGKLKVFSKSKGYLGEVDLVSKSNVDRSTWLFFLDCVKNFLKNPLIVIIFSLALIFLIAIIIIISVYIKKNNRRVRYRESGRERDKNRK